MKKQLILFLATVLVIAFACQKELSFESPNAISIGSLKDDVSGDCLPQTVNGAYIAGTALVAATNTIVVQVDVAQTGSYTIYTDTVNGYYFRTTGVFTNTGLTNVTLRSNGTPFAAGINNFVVTYDTSICNIAVTVMPAGTGAAAFTLVSGGTPTNCASAVVSGTYTQNVGLVAANNYVDITVDVATVGTYNISATDGQMTFSKTGTFTATGVQTVRLDGSGTPTTSGAHTMTFAAPFASCSFTVTVTAAGGPAVFTLVSGGTPINCASAVVNGAYVQSTALVPVTNYVDITVNVSTIGTYTITATGGGMTFSKTGSFTATGNQTVRLDGSGTAPSTTGNTTVTFGTPFASCTFTVYVLANDYYPRTATSNWSYEWDDVPTDSLYRVATSNTITAGSVFTIFMSNDGTGLDSGGYYRRSGTDYFEWFDFGTWIGYDNPLWVEYTMLQSAAAEATPWKSPPTGGWAGTAGGNNFNLRFSYKILAGQKNVPITFNTSINPSGITYQDVIVVEERFEREVTPGNWQDFTSAINYYGKSYYARGIGLIKFEAYNASNVLQAKMELRRWQVL
ncbi:MAG: hypothetical protein HZB42_06430 [Sphingobacteriales bacterium]|nr:hypothetical protein [Sphingobacteriales bacterium]